MALRIGSTLVSTVDDTAVVIVRWSAGDATLTCGGAPMVEKSRYDGTTRDTTDAASAPGTLLGKRYVADDAVEVLCVKSGAGPLALDGTPLTVKAAKPLPASD
jgi:hypothetical protein